MMKRRNFLFAIFFAVAVATFAVPAKRVKKVIAQPDGTQLSVQLCGNEYLHYYMTDDNVPVLEDENGTFVYAQVANGFLQATAHVAHEKTHRSEAEADIVQHLNVSAEVLAQIQGTRVAARAKSRVATTRNATSTRTPIIGEKRGLVILVNFKDNSFSQNDPKATFNAMMNEVNYSENGQYGSVHDYFLAQSNNQFSLNFDVVGPVTLAYTLNYYGRNDRYGDDEHPGAMVAEACKAISNQVDFSNYDWDGDGYVDQVYIIYAGYNEAQGAASNTIWPHEHTLSDSDYGNVLTYNGVKIDTYACSSELSGTKGTTIDGIGTTCHEFSHCLGFPDFYDTENSTYGMDTWDLMDYGCYLDPPCGYTSYERMYCGWLTPVELNEGASISKMKALSDGGEAYIVYNDAFKNEYYLLENRQQTGWDSGLVGHGLLVLHVDYDKMAWDYNTVNSTINHPRMSPLPADNSLLVFGDASTTLAYIQGVMGDTYPGFAEVTELTDTSTPAATLYHSNATGTKFMGKPITDITEDANGLISFNFMGGSVLIEDSISNTGIDTKTGYAYTTASQLIKALEAGDTRLRLFTVDGTQLNAASVRSLKKGIYIIRDAQGAAYKISLP